MHETFDAEAILRWSPTLNLSAQGGTEQMAIALFQRLKPEVSNKFQIWFSRYDESKVDRNKNQVLYVHDLPGDPMYDFISNNNVWREFDKVIFVSNHQMQKFIDFYKPTWLPWSKCVVMRNAIAPISSTKASIQCWDKWMRRKPEDPIRIIYHTTPHRGLNIVDAVIKTLNKEHPDLNYVVDIFSSFGVYGWQDPVQFKGLFESLQKSHNVTYHGAQPNEVVREALVKSHIFFYPSIWEETSCIAMMEAMASGNLVIHPNYGALYETAAGYSQMYQWHEDVNAHFQIAYKELEKTLLPLVNCDNTSMAHQIAGGAMRHALQYSWDRRIKEWDELLGEIL